jgi:hypothetical protein
MSVVSLAAAREERQPHLMGECLCIGCRHEWAGVAPVGVWLMECPSCGSMKGIWRNPIGASPGDSFFSCVCGCEALTAYQREGLFHLKCMSCGTEQTNAVFGDAP